MGKATLQLNTYLGPYYLVKLIAIGGMAEIYLASTKGVAGFEKQLALKVIHPDYADDQRFVQMLVDEAKISVKLNHPNIAQTFDLGRIENCYFISMEFVDGADFFQILKKVSEMNDEFPVDAALFVVSEALLGLGYAHKTCDDDGSPLQIIHRDMSPQNILVSRFGEVKITDFGIAKAANLSTKTRAGVIKGKLVYMSPEQSWGDKVDQRTDIFSAGIVLYEALTGGSLYMEKNPVRLLERVRKAEIPPPSSRRPAEISPELDAIVMKALSPRPADRYQSAMEFSEVVTGYLRRQAPDYSPQQLGDLMEAVLSGRKPSSLPKPVSTYVPPQQPDMMARDDFELQEHSVIFNPDEMIAADRAAQGPRPTSSLPMIARVVLMEETGDTPYTLAEHFVIGRAGDLRLGDARVSRRHAKIVLSEGSYMLEDMQSANGTYLNEEKIAAPRALNPGDMIRTGPFRIRFELVEDVPTAAPTPPVAPPHMQQPPQPEIPDATLEADAVRSSAPQPFPPGYVAPQPTGHPTPSPPPQQVPPPVPPHQQVTPAPQPTGPPPRQQAAAQEEPTAAAEVLQSDGAAVILRLGPERISLPVGDRLPLSHTVSLDNTNLVGESAALVRRSDGYWLEPVPGKITVRLNGQPLSAPAHLNAGDLVSVGPVELEFLPKV